MAGTETIAFVDCSAGIAGDMLLGALIDAGAPLEDIVRGLNSLHGIRGEWGLRTTKVWKGPGQIAGTKVHVDSIFEHRAIVPPGGGDSERKQDQEHGNEVESRGHDHAHDHSHSHGHGSHSHEHSDSPRYEDSMSEERNRLDQEDVHSHSHSHSHDHGHGGHDHGSEGGEPMRNLDDIKRLVMSSDLSEWVKTQSIAVFTLLAQAEAHTHGTTLEQIHFHEVGAIDSIIDTVGSVLAMDLLGVRQVYSSFLPFSSGTVKCAHGILPVPPPATFRLMIDVPVCPAPRGAKGELVTPTGISLVKALTSAYGEPPAFIPTHTGVGAGTKEFPYHANIVRVAIGKKIDPNAIQKAYASAAMATSLGLPETRPSSSTDTTASATGSLPYDQEDVLVLETNLDDLNPQAFGYVFERLLDDGHALDVWTQPIQMKKSRPGVCLSVLCQPKQEASVLKTLFQETTTLGVRKKTLARVFLRREFISISAFERVVAVKLGYYGNKIVNVYPEYEHCKVRERPRSTSWSQIEVSLVKRRTDESLRFFLQGIAKDTGLPLLHVIHEVQSLATKFIESQ